MVMVVPRPWDAKMCATLRRQDHLYCLLTRSRHEAKACIIGSILDFLLLPEHPQVIDRLMEVGDAHFGARAAAVFLAAVVDVAPGFVCTT